MSRRLHFWKSREAMSENYLDSDFFKEVLTSNNPDFKNITATRPLKIWRSLQNRI